MRKGSASRRGAVGAAAMRAAGEASLAHSLAAAAATFASIGAVSAKRVGKGSSVEFFVELEDDGC